MVIKAVVFDLDDTLISEKEYVKSGFRKVAEYMEQKYAYKKKNVYMQLMELFEEDSKNVFNRFLDKNKIKYNENDIQEIVVIYKNHKPKIKFYSDVITTIEKLKKANIKVGIITDGRKETQKLKLQTLNAYNIFDEIIVTDELGKEFWKPNIKAFQMMKERFNIQFEEMMYVGDNPEKDFFIKKLCPIKCVRIHRTNTIYANKVYKENIKEDYEVKTIGEILIIENIGTNAN